MLFDWSPLTILGILAFFLLILILPTLMRMRLIASLSKTILELEEMVKESKMILIHTSQEKGKAAQNSQIAIENFLEFFIVPPVDMDPAGIVEKFDKILEMGEERFQEMANIIVPQADSEIKSNIIMTLKASIGLNNVVKHMRHHLELARKTGNIQLLFALQMNLAIILRLIKAQFESVKSFAEGVPIGDGVGPLIASLMMREDKNGDLEHEEDIVMLKKEFKNRELIILRSKGPGARIGKLSKIVPPLIDKQQIDQIITIDAAAKLEGEKTGKVAEGIGVVIGGLGIDKWFLEEKSIKEDLRMNAIIIKMSPEEAITPMSPKILNSSKKALQILEKSIMRTPENSRILIIGVGNSCGIPNIVSDPSQIEVKKEDDKNKQR